MEHPAAVADASGEDLHTGDRIARYLENKGWPPELVVLAISTLPIVELRGAVPVGINLLKMNWAWVLFLSVAGNMIPIPFILLFLGPFSRFCMKFRTGRAFFEWLFARTRRKSASIEKYETLGLTIFVAIPLPATGGWTGAMAAFLMGMKFHHAMLSILLGVGDCRRDHDGPVADGLDRGGRGRRGPDRPGGQRPGRAAETGRKEGCP